MYIYVYMCVHMYTSRQGEGQLYGEELSYILSHPFRRLIRVSLLMCVYVCVRVAYASVHVFALTHTQNVHAKCIPAAARIHYTMFPN